MYQRLRPALFRMPVRNYELWLNQAKLPPVFPELTMKGWPISNWYQELLREHGESRWPEIWWPGLLRWYMSQQNPVIDISPDTSYCAIPSPCSPYLPLLLPAVKQHLVFLRIS